MKLNQNIFDDIFQNNMVLPINKDFKVGGKISPNECIEIVIPNKKYKIYADKDGCWSLSISYTQQKENFWISAKTKKSKQTIQNIKFGLVFLLSGQSNIEYRLKDEKNYQEALNELGNKCYSDIYYYNVPQIEYIDPDTQAILPKNIQQETWKQLTESTAKDISAVGYYLVTRLRKLGIKLPIGVVDCFKGGTSASAWISLDKLSSDKELYENFVVPYLNEIKGKKQADFEEQTKKYEQSVKEHQKKLNNFLSANPSVSLSEAKNIVGHTPWPPPMRPDLYTRPGGLYDTMIKQVSNLTVNSLIWYQGENDTDRAKYYHKLLLLLLHSWRDILQDNSLNIKLIQLPGYEDYPENSGALIRQVQFQVSCEVPNVDLVSFVDAGEKHNIHPINKKVVGYRLGNCLSGFSYAETPKLYKVEISQGQITCSISHCWRLQKISGKDIVIQLILKNGKIIDYLVTADDLEGNIFKINYPNIEEIASCSYGYTNYPNLALENELHYPVSPFIFSL